MPAESVDRQIYQVTVADGKGPALVRVVRTPETIRVLPQHADEFGNLYYTESQVIRRQDNEELYSLLVALLQWTPPNKP